MSYPKDLEEHTDAELVAELNRRHQLYAKGQCPYRHTTAIARTVCNQPEQHEVAYRRWLRLQQLREPACATT